MKVILTRFTQTMLNVSHELNVKDDMNVEKTHIVDKVHVFVYNDSR